MITPESLSRAIDRKRLVLAANRGDIEPIHLSEVAGQLDIHPSQLSRIRSGAMPSKPTFEKILAWLGDDADPTCTECEELSALEALAEDEEPKPKPKSDDDDVDEADDEAEEDDDTPEDEDELVKAVYAVGKLSESDDPDTQAAVNRAKELLKEGAVGVSVALDLHPDDAKAFADAEKRAGEDGWESPIEDYLPKDFKPRQRIRHTAIVGTPAFADARLELQDDGVTVMGVVTFQGEWTGDLRNTEVIDLESSRVPSPILYNRDTEGHEGPTIGFIESFEWVERPPSSHRPVLNDEAITASIKPMEFPARYFAQTVPTGPEPLRISAPDAQGYRAIRGLAAPKGICHRSSMACWTWPGDMDPQHRHFHTGTLIGLDDGSDIRVGALTMGGAHLDPALAKQGVRASSVGNHRDDANRVFALVRVWETRFGLMCAGIVPPDVTEGDVARALACSPSIEFWPENGRRTLVGLHLVPTPALPVLASMGEAEVVITDEKLEVEPTPEPEVEEAAEVTLDMLSDQINALGAELSVIIDKIAAVDEVANAILALTPVDSIEIE